MAKKKVSKPKDVKKAVAPKEPNAAQKKYSKIKSGLYTTVKNGVRVFLTKKEYDKLK